MPLTGKLAVKTAEHSGIPYVQVPSEAMWDLVEFLSYNRTPVHYTYEATCFTVQFLRLDQVAAQALLDNWHVHEYAGAEA